MKLSDLLKQRTAKVTEMRALSDAAQGAALDDNATARFNTLDAEVTTLNTRIAQEQRIAEQERQFAARPENGGTGLSDLDADVKKFDPLKLIRSQLPEHRGIDIARELAVSDEFRKRNGYAGEGFCVPLAALHRPVLEQRAIIAWGAGSGTGGALVPEQHLANEFIDPLRPAIDGVLPGARFLSGLTGAPVHIPKGTATSATFVGENAEIPASDPTFSNVALSPHLAGARTSYTRNLLNQSSPAVQALVSENLIAAIAQATIRVAINGGGADEPSGIFDTVAPTAMGEPTWEAILEIIEGLEVANVQGSSLAWLAHPSVVRKLRSTPKLTFGSPAAVAGMGDFIMPNARTLADYPLASTTLVPTTGSSPAGDAGLSFQDMSQLVLGVWEAANVLVNPYAETEYNRGSVAVRVTAMVDVGIRHAAAFKTVQVAV